MVRAFSYVVPHNLKEKTMLACNSNDSLKTRRSLKVGQTNYDYFSLKAAQQNGLGDLSKTSILIMYFVREFATF